MQGQPLLAACAAAKRVAGRCAGVASWDLQLATVDDVTDEARSCDWREAVLQRGCGLRQGHVGVATSEGGRIEGEAEKLQPTRGMIRRRV